MFRHRPLSRWGRRTVIAAPLALLALVLFSGVASAHAELLRSDPTQNVILTRAPAQVRLWFSEAVNPALVRIEVVTPGNQEVDGRDTQVFPTDPDEVVVDLPSLPGGTYVVFWQVTSADDGHPSAGFFLFRVRFPDGSVPALPGELPTVPGGLNTGSAGQCLTGDAPLLCVPGIFSDWLVLLAAMGWVGGLFWQYLLIERAAQRDHSLVSTAQATARRFRWLSWLALQLFLVANLGYVAGQAMLAGGSWDQGFSPTLWNGFVLHSSFGVFWIVRLLLGLLALLVLVAVVPRPPLSEEAWRPHAGLGWVQLTLGLLLLGALAASGHAAAAQGKGKLGPFAIPVDWLHLLSTSLWVGGLFFVALILLPAVWKQAPLQRAQVLVKLLPRFSVIALVSVAVAAVSGSLNADVQLSSWDQLLGTAYGRTLVIKTLLVLVMVAISAYHAFRLRPALASRLARRAELAGARHAGQDDVASAELSPELAGEQQSTLSATSLTRAERLLASARVRLVRPSQPVAQANPRESDAHKPADEQEPDPSAESLEDPRHSPGGEGDAQQEGEPETTASRWLADIEALTQRLRTWLHREALLGAGVVLCAALLAGLAGTLAPGGVGQPNVNAPPMTATTKTPVTLTQTADGLQVTLKVAPAQFGLNTFGVLVKDAASGKPIDGATAQLLANDLDMDMGTETLDLAGVGSGFYRVQGDLVMGGHWQVRLQVRVPKDPKTIHRFTFTFSASF